MKLYLQNHVPPTTLSKITSPLVAPFASLHAEVVGPPAIDPRSLALAPAISVARLLRLPWRQTRLCKITNCELLPAILSAILSAKGTETIDVLDLSDLDHSFSLLTYSLYSFSCRSRFSSAIFFTSGLYLCRCNQCLIDLGKLWFF